jgi:hypothetical protein
MSQVQEIHSGLLVKDLKEVARKKGIYLPSKVRRKSQIITFLLSKIPEVSKESKEEKKDESPFIIALRQISVPGHITISDWEKFCVTFKIQLPFLPNYEKVLEAIKHYLTSRGLSMPKTREEFERIMNLRTEDPTIIICPDHDGYALHTLLLQWLPNSKERLAGLIPFHNQGAVVAQFFNDYGLISPILEPQLAPDTKQNYVDVKKAIGVLEKLKVERKVLPKVPIFDPKRPRYLLSIHVAKLTPTGFSADPAQLYPHTLLDLQLISKNEGLDYKELSREDLFFLIQDLKSSGLKNLNPSFHSELPVGIDKKDCKGNASLQGLDSWDSISQNEFYAYGPVGGNWYIYHRDILSSSFERLKEFREEFNGVEFKDTSIVDLERIARKDDSKEGDNFRSVIRAVLDYPRNRAKDEDELLAKIKSFFYESSSSGGAQVVSKDAVASPLGAESKAEKNPFSFISVMALPPGGISFEIQTCGNKFNIKKLFKALIEAGFYMRSWKGGDSPYPLVRKDISKLTFEEIEKNSVIGLSFVNESLNSLPENLRLLILSLKTKDWKGGKYTNVEKKEQGTNLADVLKLVTEKGADQKDVNACMNLCARFIIRTSMYYSHLLIGETGVNFAPEDLEWHV